MNRRNMKMMVEFSMKNSYIAEPNDPFRSLHEFFKVELINDPYTAIATSRTHNGMDCRVVEHLLHIGKSFRIGSPKSKIPFSNGLAQTNIKTPSANRFNSRL